MALLEGDVKNFNTLIAAVNNKDVCIMECKDAKTKEYVAVVCAVNREDDGSASFIPLAKLFTGDPFDEVLPPDADQKADADMDQLDRSGNMEGCRDQGEFRDALVRNYEDKS